MNRCYVIKPINESFLIKWVEERSPIPIPAHNKNDDLSNSTIIIVQFDRLDYSIMLFMSFIYYICIFYFTFDYILHYFYD